MGGVRGERTMTTTATRPWIAAALAVALTGSACHRRESLESSRVRAQETVLVSEIADLKTLIAKKQTGPADSLDRIGIGISAETSKALLDASLPQEQVIGGRVRIRIETAFPFFEGNNAAIVFRASARSLRTSAEAHLEMGGRLKDFKIEKGKLVADIQLVHFKVLDSSLGDLGSDVLENLVRSNMDRLSGLLPGLAIPVGIEEAIEIPGLSEGVVTVKPGVLPLKVALAEVVPVNKRLWVLLDVKAGPWARTDAKGKP
jgi:hypothetical protein